MFQVGDTVQLKSGGPTVTVSRIGNLGDGVPIIACTWFDGSEVKQKSFPPESLKAAT